MAQQNLQQHSPDILASVSQLRQVLPSISDALAAEMEEVTARYAFRLPRFYAQHVLRDDPADPLWQLALPGRVELADTGEERWDSFQLPARVADHPRLVQKYPYEALLRTTDHCSGLCRYCYLKNRSVTPGCISHGEIDAVFDQVEGSPHRHALRELVLSGGDPLAAPASTLEHIAQRIDRLNRTVRRRITVTVHTREPVWNPFHILDNARLLAALGLLSPSSYIMHIVHQREVTQPLLRAIEALDAAGRSRRPIMLIQHPLFRGISSDPAEISAMYDAADSGAVVVKPYYLIHPFPDGTLPQHRLRLAESQAILRQLASAPGTRVPMLTVPTPMGKCVIGPYEQLVEQNGHYLLHTKDGVPVRYAVAEHYNPVEDRAAIPIMPNISAARRAS